MAPSENNRALTLRQRPRRRRFGLWHLLIALGTLAAFAALIGLFAHYYTPQSPRTIALAAFSPYLLGSAIIAAILFGLARSAPGHVGLVIALVLALWSIGLRGPLFTASTLPAGGHDAVVMTANLKLGAADPAWVVAAVRRHHVDVLMLEELTVEAFDALQTAGLHDLLPYDVAEPGPRAVGTGLWSRYRLNDRDVRHDFGFAFITARVAIPGSLHQATAVALHMSAPYPQASQWLRDIGHLPGVLRNLPSDAPVLVGGDFNATPDMAQFRSLLHDGYADAADQAGAGAKATYPADRWFPPLIVIDHVLTRAAVAHQVDTLEIPGSDHRALLVTVRLPG